MRKLAVTLAFATVFLLFNAQAAYGQDQETVNVSVTIPQVLVLDVNANSIPYGTINDNQVGTTIRASTNTVLSFRGNVPMSLNVASTSNFFDANVDDANDGTKPSTDLAWSATSTGAVTLANTSGTFSTTPTSLFSGQARGAYNDEITVEYDLTVNWTDTPDTYDLDVVYTLSAT